MDVREKYHNKHTGHLLKLHSIWRSVDHGKLTWDDSERMEKELDRRFLISLMMWFGRLSYDEQIQLAVHSGHPKLIARLDDAQRAAMVIMS